MSKENKVVWGVDVAGRTASNGLARGEIKDNKLKITIFNTSNLKAESLNSSEKDDPLGEFFKKVLETENNILVIDTALDLQLLGDWDKLFKNIIENWQEVNRPVDKAYGGLNPLADRIGSAVVRTHRFLTKIDPSWNKDDSEILGATVFETYPAAILAELADTTAMSTFDKGYKEARIIKGGDGWEPHGIFKLGAQFLYESLELDYRDFKILTNDKVRSPSKSLTLEELLEDGHNFNQNLVYQIQRIYNEEIGNFAKNANALRFEAKKGLVLDDDEFDAALCVWVYFQQCYDEAGDPFRERIRSRIEKKIKQSTKVGDLSPPKGYLLPQRWNSELKVEIEKSDKLPFYP